MIAVGLGLLAVAFVLCLIGDAPLTVSALPGLADAVTQAASYLAAGGALLVLVGFIIKLAHLVIDF